LQVKRVTLYLILCT